MALFSIIGITNEIVGVIETKITTGTQVAQYLLKLHHIGHRCQIKIFKTINYMIKDYDYKTGIYTVMLKSHDIRKDTVCKCNNIMLHKLKSFKRENQYEQV